ncbi:MAG TPA: efflux RND transporter periplasmic adaptor subunit, partial [Rhodocyclaceae bacterium]|nr:efflux RND transporter periplasmic adaptor subunit [Rhodocyclaceae bacterium]
MNPSAFRAFPSLLLLAGVLPLLAACQKNEVTPPPPRGVIAFEVKAESRGGGAFYSGEVRPRVESVLAFRIAGKLVERRVELGEVVKAGQLLARLDRTDPTLVAQAAGNQQAAAEAELALARADAERFASLRTQNFVSQAALDGKQTALKAAENRAAAARAQADTASNQAAYADLVADAAGVVSAVLAEPGQVLAVGAPVLRVARLGGDDK